jgi:hypothetical protein
MPRHSHSAKNPASPFLSLRVKIIVDALPGPVHLCGMKKEKLTPLAAWIKAQGRGSISRLSEQTGLSTGHIHNIMKGAGMTTSTAKTLAKATGISAAVLMGLENA